MLTAGLNLRRQPTLQPLIQHVDVDLVDVVAALELVVLDRDAHRLQRLPNLVRRADGNLLIVGAVSEEDRKASQPFRRRVIVTDCRCQPAAQDRGPCDLLRLRQRNRQRQRRALAESG